MSNRFVAKHGLDNSSNTIINLAAPVNPTDAVNLATLTTSGGTGSGYVAQSNNVVLGVSASTLSISTAGLGTSITASNGSIVLNSASSYATQINSNLIVAGSAISVQPSSGSGNVVVHEAGGGNAPSLSSAPSGSAPFIQVFAGSDPDVNFNFILPGAGTLQVNGTPVGGGGGGSGTVTSVAVSVPSGLAVSGSPITTSGTLAITASGQFVASQMPAFTGDVTTSAGAVATTLATVNSNVGQFAVQTVNGKGLVTAATTLAATGDATGTSSGAGLALTLATVNSNVGTFQGLTVNDKGLVTAASNQNYMVNPLTTTGDIVYSSSGTTAARLAIGTTNQIMTVTAGVPAWQTPVSVAPIMYFFRGMT